MSERYCPRCEQMKPIEEYRPTRSYCQQCRSEYAKALRAANYERALEANRRSQKRFREQHPNYVAEWRAANRERCNAYQRAYYSRRKQREQAAV